LGDEASKTRALWPAELFEILSGKGLDIGAGRDPIAPHVRVFDLEHGDAGRIDEYLDEHFDYVFSSHCLEHMVDPVDALQRWWSLVRPGGHLILVIPDENLYEQGYWPSVFNEDHKATFRIPSETWSPSSHRISELIETLRDIDQYTVSLQDDGYIRFPQVTLAKRQRTKPIRQWLFKKTRKLASMLAVKVDWRFLIPWGVAVDQTAYGALAQIQVVARKKPQP